MSRLQTALLAAALACSFTGANAAPTTYNIVSKISRVNFSLRHQGFIDLFGTVRLTPGRFVFDSDDWSRSSIQVSMIEHIVHGDERDESSLGNRLQPHEAAVVVAAVKHGCGQPNWRA